MAINAGVTSTAAREGKIDDPNRLARELMEDSKALTMAVICIRETLHYDVNDIVYGCRCVYDEGKKRGMELPLFYGNMERIINALPGMSSAHAPVVNVATAYEVGELFVGEI